MEIGKWNRKHTAAHIKSNVILKELIYSVLTKKNPTKTKQKCQQKGSSFFPQHIYGLILWLLTLTNILCVSVFCLWVESMKHFPPHCSICVRLQITTNKCR